jgi:hypothetical protein
VIITLTSGLRGNGTIFEKSVNLSSVENGEFFKIIIARESCGFHLFSHHSFDILQRLPFDVGRIKNALYPENLQSQA